MIYFCVAARTYATYHRFARSKGQVVMFGMKFRVATRLAFAAFGLTVAGGSLSWATEHCNADVTLGRSRINAGIWTGEFAVEVAQCPYSTGRFVINIITENSRGEMTVAESSQDWAFGEENHDVVVHKVKLGTGQIDHVWISRKPECTCKIPTAQTAAAETVAVD